MEYLCDYEFNEIKILLSSDGQNLTGLWFDKQKYFGKTLKSNTIYNEDLEIFKITKNWLNIYFNGEKPEFLPPLAPKGSEFRQMVWHILLKIPYGEVTTYGEIAKEICKIKGLKKMSAQAVGGAVGNNPISIIIPCHRVVGTNGSLTGYASGISNKIYLLKTEGINIDNFFVPKKGTAL